MHPPPLQPAAPPKSVTRSFLRKALGVVVVVVAVAVAVVGWTILKVRDTSRLKAMIPRQLASAADQFTLENPDRIFVNYAELVGPTRWVTAYRPVDGEDPSRQFPIRCHWDDLLPVELPDGTTVTRGEVFISIGQSGLVATLPQPQDAHYDPGRVYRTDFGVSFRGDRVVDLPPDPAGRDGRDQDGVHVYRLPDGRRFEVTYHGGVPDGPFRAFYADGSAWGEATYRQGHVVAAWLTTRLGRRFDELHDGPAATEASNADAETVAAKITLRALAKLAVHDFRGAIDNFTSAIACAPDFARYLGRAEAKVGLGDLEGAIADCQLAEEYAPRDKLQEIVRRRTELEQQKTTH